MTATPQVAVSVDVFDQGVVPPGGGDGIPPGAYSGQVGYLWGRTPIAYQGAMRWGGRIRMIEA
jgi:hypothetical protein